MGGAVLRADARALPLPGASVDLIVTSPPYLGLRSYTDAGEHYDGQIGSEATPQEWLAAMVECTREMMRVLKPEGSIFVNLGDKYSGAQGPKTGTRSEALQSSKHGHGGGKKWVTSDRGEAVQGFRDKTLLGLPWRYALGCVDRLGLILRAEIIWAKPNGLPESVTDRVRRSHEQVFHFVRSPRYYAAVDEIREPHTGTSHPQKREPVGSASGNGVRHRTFAGQTEVYNPLGKLPGSVWDIPSAPLAVPASLGVDHFAAFPPGLVRPIVLGWSPPGICVECGQGRRPVVGRDRILEPGRRQLGLGATHAKFRVGPQTGGPDEASSLHHLNTYAITGYACACPQPTAPTRPSVVCDPFGGTGTTALVASAYGRHGVTVDLSADYCRLARWRVSDPGERARARRAPKPPPVPDGQSALFEMTRGGWP